MRFVEILSLPYWTHLLAISMAFVLLERLWPWRPQQLFRRAIFTDALYLGFNGYVLAFVLAPLTDRVAPLFDGLVTPWTGQPFLDGRPMWLQAVVVFFLIDLIKWCIHVLLHRLGFLWVLHRVHHSITEMDWLGSMRFHWMEIVVYDSVLHLPLLLLGVDWRVLAANSIFSTVMGHLNHSNLKVGLGPLGFVFNHPTMHIWHHDHELHFSAGCNFGINLSLWDWVFGTAYLPRDQRQPVRLGFPGIKVFPSGFLGQQLVPLSTLVGRSARRRHGSDRRT